MKEIVIAAAMALALSGQQPGQQSAPQQQQQAPASPQNPQQNAIPDAPKPQLTGTGPVAPGIGTTPAYNGESGSTQADDGFQTAPEGGATPAKPAPDVEQGAAPLTPANSRDIMDNPLVLHVNTVEIPFTVKDSKSRLVPGLTWRDVHVYENNVRQRMTVFTVDPAPLSVALVIDQSMGFHDMAKVNNALGALPGAFAAYDEVAVFTYNNGPKLRSDYTGGQSARLAAILEQSKSPGREQLYYDASGPMAQGIDINNGAEKSETPLSGGGPGSPQGLSHDQVPREVHTLNDAIMMAAKSLTKAPRGRRRVIYVISDGKEYGSVAKTKDVIRYLQEYKIELSATLVGDASVKGMGFIDAVHLPLTMRDNILPVYTKATGGQIFADYLQKGIESSFARITEEARTQYTVWYNSREAITDGKFRKVEVRVLRPNLQVIAKQGYYPSPQDQPRPTVPFRPVAESAPTPAGAPPTSQP